MTSRLFEKQLNTALSPRPGLRGDGSFGMKALTAVLRFHGDNWLADGESVHVERSTLRIYDPWSPQRARPTLGWGYHLTQEMLLLGRAQGIFEAPGYSPSLLLGM